MKSKAPPLVLLVFLLVLAGIALLLRPSGSGLNPAEGEGTPGAGTDSPVAAGAPEAEPAHFRGNNRPHPLPADHRLADWTIADYAEAEGDGGPERIWVLRNPRDPSEHFRVQRTELPGGIVAEEVMVADRVLLSVPAAEAQRKLDEALRDFGYVVVKQFRFQPTRVVRLDAPTVEAVPLALERLKPLLDSAGAFVEPDPVSFPAETIPDDPLWDSQMWSLRQIDAPLAWDITTGSEDVVVAVQDTKLTVTHPDLQDNVWVNPGEIAGNGIDDDHNGYVDDLHGWNVHSNSADLLYNVVNNHGEHVAGTVAAVGDNATGVVGVNWNSKIMFFSVSDGLSSSETAEAIEYTVWMKRNKGINVVSHNCSFGSLYTNSTYAGSSTRKRAIALGRDEGILFTAAAGNDGKALEGTADLDGSGTWYNHYPSSNTVVDYPSPGDWEAMVAVAASQGTSDGKAGFSNYNLAGYGTVVDVAAPGVGIHSTVNASSYTDKNGTSMASPHVAGAHGLVAAANPSLGGKAIRDLVYAGVESVGAWTDTKTNAQGRLNLYNSVLAAHNLPQAKLLSPSTGSFIPAGHGVPLLAEASDGNGSVTSVAFHAVGSDGSDTLVATDTDGSDGWSHLWTNPAADQYAFYAVATDNEGNSTVPDLKTVRVSVGSYFRDEDEQWPLESEGIWNNDYLKNYYSGDFFGRSVAYNYGTSGGDDPVYTFYLTPAYSGSWEVFLRWPYRSGNGATVPVELAHDGGPFTTSLDMSISQDGYQFNSLGTFSFTAGQTYAMKVAAPADQWVYVPVDAVRMDFQGTVSTPVVSVSADDDSGAEAGPDDGRFTFVRTLASGSLTVLYTMGGTATNGDDYAALSGSVTFADGEFVSSLVLDVTDDNAIEADETAVLTLSADAAYTVDPGAASASATITSEDFAGTLSFDPASVSVSEGGGSVSLTVTRTGGSTGAVSVAYASAAGSAAAGADFTATSGTLDWADGETASKNFSVPVLEDGATEGAESFSLNLSGPTGQAVIGTASATVTINDNDFNSAPVVTISEPASSVTLPGVSNHLALQAEVNDDGEPVWGTLTGGWSQVSGPAGQSTVFADAASTATSATFPAEGSYLLRFTADDGEFDSAAEVSVFIGTPGSPAPGSGVDREVFQGISGTAVSNLTGASKFINGQPDESGVLDSLFEAPTNVGDNYGQRVRGYFIPSQSGDHVFWIASDDSSELWLSTGTDPGNKVLVASVSGWTSSREWTKYPGTQESAPVAMTAGQAYYIEALQKEGSGGDNLAVGVTHPDATLERPVTASHLALFNDVPANSAPSVDAGAAVSGPALTGLALDGTVQDDGEPDPPGAVTTQWTQISGPGTATFGDASAVDTTVNTDTPGSYVLRLTADDGGAVTFDETSLEVAALTAAESWRHQYFNQTQNSGDAADGTDFDLDGSVNLLERAFGTVPTDEGSVFVPWESVDEDGGSHHLGLVYRRLGGGSGTTAVDYTADGLRYTVLHDGDLQDPWNSGSLTVLSVTDNGDGTETVTVRLDPQLLPGAPQFIRLKVEAVAP